MKIREIQSLNVRGNARVAIEIGDERSGSRLSEGLILHDGEKIVLEKDGMRVRLYAEAEENQRG